MYQNYPGLILSTIVINFMVTLLSLICIASDLFDSCNSFAIFNYVMIIIGKAFFKNNII